MEIFGQAPFVYATTNVHFPFAKGTTTDGNVVYLMIKDTTQSIGIIKNKKLGGGKNTKYTRYYKARAYNAKIFNKTVRKKMLPSDVKDLRASIANMSMVYFDNPHAVKTKNVVVDLSTFNEAFFSSCEGKNMKLISTLYISFLKKYMETYCSFPHEHKFIILNIEDWHMDAKALSKVTSTMDKNLNPLSILYYLMKTDIKALEPLEGYRFVILDGENGWVSFMMEDIDDTSFTKLYAGIKKFRTETSTMVPDDPDLDERRLEIEKDAVSTPVIDEEPEEPEEEGEYFNEDGEVITPAARAAMKKAIEDEGDDYDDKLLKAAEELEVNRETAERSSVSNARDKHLRELQKKIKVDDISLGDIDNYLESGSGKIDYTIEEDDISSKIFAPKDSIGKIKFDNFNKSYVKNVMRKDIASIFNTLKHRSHPVFVRDIKIEDTSTEMDLKETWKVTLEGSDRVRHTITIDVPKVYDNNYFFLGGNRKQFVSQLYLKPVVKIAPDTVQICTNYNKIFMYRYGDILSPKMTIFKKIIANNPKYFKCKRGNGMALSGDHKTSIEYDSIAKDYMDIEIRGTGVHLRCDQKFFDSEIEAKSIAPIQDDYLYCIFDERKKPGNKLRAIPINIDRDADGRDDTEDESFNKNSIVDVFAELFKEETKQDFWALAGPKEKAGKRFMYTRCKVMQKFIPTVLLCAYFEGLTTTMNKAGVKYEFTDKRVHIDHTKGIIEFADGYLVYDREPTSSSLLMNGLSTISTKNYEFSEFDKKDVYLDIFDVLYDSRILAVALNSYYDNMIDPKTYEYLKKHNYPTDIVSLILFGSSLMADNNHENELDMRIYRIRNMEMVYSYLYKIIAHAYSAYERTAMNKTPIKISVPRNELLKEILTSNVLEDYSIINPITEKEKLHTLSVKGPSGMNLARGMTEAKRCYDPSMTGLIGVSTSPDANVGVQRELTIEPKVIDTFGTIDMEKPNKDMRDMNMFTYAEQLTPGSIMRDDAIRSSMMSKQSKHMIPVADASPVLISTGVEKSLPYTISKDFAIKARADGKVKEYDKSTNMMILAYKDGTHEAVNLNSVIVKNGGGGFYLANKLTSDYKVGQSFKKNDIIASDKQFFSKHYDGVKFNLGTLCKCAIMSSFGTFEDAKLITHSLSERMATEMIMSKHLVLGNNATIESIVKVGQEVKVGDDLIKYEVSNSEKEMNRLLRNIGEDMQEDIKSLGKTAIHSKYNGVIEEIRIYSTYELNELSPSLKRVVGDYWSAIRKKKALVHKYKIKDPSETGSTFYEASGPIKPDERGRFKGYKVDEGGVIFEFYIKFRDPVGIGDKLCDYAALKGVTCGVIPKGQEPFTPRKPDEEISTIFPANSVMSRMTTSILPVIWGNKVLIELKEHLKGMYENGK